MNHAFLIADSFLALLAVVINFIFVILVLVRTSRTDVYKTFFFICFSVMYWNLSEFMRYTTGRPYWFYLSRIGSAFIPALMFHFIMALVRPNQKNTRWTAPPYFFSCLLALISFVSLFHSGTQKHAGDAYWDMAYFLSFGPFFLSGLYMLIDAIRATRSEDEKSRLRYVMIADIIGLIAVTTDHAQTLKIPVPPLGHLGSVIYSSILAVGIFKHKAAYDVLAQMRENLGALSEMAAGIAHEIRNPLSSLKGASNLLKSELKDHDHAEGREYLNIITEEIDQLNNILTNFQYFTKPLKIEKEPLPLNEVILKTIKLAEIDTPELSIRSQLSGEVGMVRADASLLKQVFLNLIKNAADACDPEGELIIQTECDPHWVTISFSDNGPGIQPNLLDHIFEPFFTTKTSGVGVGLAISRKIIEAHGGRIEAVNVLPKGTRFSILLPRGE
jgi:signal transduction histidine kinase